MSKTVSRNAVAPAGRTVPARVVSAAIIRADRTLEPIELVGDDSERFARIQLLLDARSLRAVVIDDNDGPAAMAWLDEFADRKGLTPNEIVSTLTDGRVTGAAVITGLGQGEQTSMTSVHDGLLRVLEQMAAGGDGPR